MSRPKSWQGLFALGLVLIITVLFPGTVLAESTVVDSLVMKDAEGRVRVELTMNDSTPELRFYDTNGKVRLLLSVPDDGPRIMLLTEDGEFAYTGLYLNRNDDGWVSVSSSHVPTDWEWLVLESIAKNNAFDALTEKLCKIGFDLAYLPWQPGNETLIAVVNTTTQPAWNYHIGQGKFSVSDREVRAAYMEAAEYVKSKLLPSLPAKTVIIEFLIQGYKVGTWTNGVMKLVGEE